jgi:hypothetical protein
VSILVCWVRWPSFKPWPDRGQHHQWPHHNGAVSDPQQWHRDRQRYEIGQLLAFEDRGDWLYVAGDATRAYSPEKLDYFTRQILFLRPGTFLVFDRVKARAATMAKTWLLQAMEVPESVAPPLSVTNGPGRLFVQTLLPSDAQTRLCAGDDLYSYGGQHYPPSRDTGPAPKCRIEISPCEPAETDYFLHVLTATCAETDSVPRATVADSPHEVLVSIGSTRIALAKDHVAARMASEDGWIVLGE